ncbi:helix-turn-helix transcriptional regulator [Nocardiopsis sediminis]|uniref:Helix-turn-helix transcriptional regulator n=1 Tax=Nocardiopsis sediminis TaxID=1778267 RepID=A0ABV8FNU5_9ACTN
MSDFTSALRSLVRQSGISQAKLARTVGWSPAQISALVNGKANPKRDHAEALDRALGAEGLLVRRWLEQKRREAEPEWMQRISDVEDHAVEIRICQPFLMPFILQSPDYTRAIVRMGRPLDTDEQVGTIVDQRMRRNKHLLREDGPKISVMLPDAVVRAAPQIAPDALSHVLDLTESSVCLQLIPDAVHLAAATGAFRLISFEDRLPVLFAEHAMGGTPFDLPREVAAFNAAANQLQAWALSPEESRKRIEELT